MNKLNLRLADLTDAEKILILEQESKEFYLPSALPPYNLPADVHLERIRSGISRPDDITGYYVIETIDKNIIAACSFYFTFHRNGYTFLRFHIFKESMDTLGTEALNLVLYLCFQNLNFNKLNVHIRGSRQSTMDIFKNCGFKIEVCSREHFFLDGSYEDIYHLGITKKDYLDVKSGMTDNKAKGEDTAAEKHIIAEDRIIAEECIVDEDYTLVTNVPPSKQLLLGQRVDLTPVTPEDAERIYLLGLKSDEKNYASIAAAAPLNSAVIRKIYQKENNYYFFNEGISFAIKKKNGEIIGTIDADSIDNRNRNLMIGLTIYDPLERGQGYGSEAIELITDFAFLEMNMHRVYLGSFAFNDKAARLYERIGFHMEGVNRAFVYRNGNYHDEIVFGVLKREWLEHRGYL